MLLERITEGLSAAIHPEALLFLLVGTLIGIVVGAAPGVGPTLGMSIMLPVAVRLDATNAIFLLVAINVASNFGNAFPAILVRVPGTPSALLTVVEGSPFHDRGEGGRALYIALWASVLGQLFGVLAFIALVVPLSRVAGRFLFPELFAIVVFGIVAATGLVSTNAWKGIAAIGIGLTLALPGADAITAIPRLTFGVGRLVQGMPIIPVTVGLLAFREVFLAASRRPKAILGAPSSLRGSKWLSRADWKGILAPTSIGTVIGIFIGAVPGAGAAVASFVAYQDIKGIYRKDQDFGKGSVRGLAAVESSNNSATAGELVPTMALGIPGATTMVVLMAALAAQGLYLGPQLMESRPDLLYSTFGGLLISVVMMAIVGYLLIKPSIHLSQLSQAGTTAVTLILIVTATFSLRWSMFDVWVCFGTGVLGYVMTRFDFPVAPAALTFILGSVLEENLRRGLVMTRGPAEFFLRPMTLSLLVAAATTFVLGVAMNRRIVDDRVGSDATSK